MIGPVFVMLFSPEWRRDTAIAVLILLTLTAFFVRATSSGDQAERGRRVWFALMAFLGGPLLGALFAGLVHAFGHVHPQDVGHVYSSHIGIGAIAGSILGLFFAITSLLSSNGPDSSPRKLNP